jgi:uncharacterized membrane protein YbhN (UPF0104 family)
MATEPETSPPKRGGKQLIRSALGLGLGALFLYLALRDVAFEQVWASLRGASLRWLPLLCLLLLLDYWLRSLRWRRMFPPHALPTRREAFDAFMIGALGNNLMPGRIGDLLRSAVIGRHLPAVGTGGALASVVLEKILDGLVLMVLLGISLALAPLPDWLSTAGLWGLVGFGGALAVLFALSLADSSARLETLAGRGRLAAFLVGMLRRLSLGLHGLRSGRRFAALLAASLPIWAVEVGLLLCCFLIFRLRLPPEAALITVIVLSVGTMLPAAPGFVGTYQFFIVTALSMYGVEQTTAVALSIFLNVFVIALTTLIGVSAMLLEGGLSQAVKVGRSRL